MLNFTKPYAGELGGGFSDLASSVLLDVLVFYIRTNFDYILNISIVYAYISHVREIILFKP